MSLSLFPYQRSIFTRASFAKTEIFKVAVGIVLLFGCSQLSIPLQPVPITLHTLAVLLIGLTYSPKEAGTTVGSYLILGALGLPVFAGYHGGVAYMLGKTGGYLIGFWTAVLVMAKLQEKQQTRKLLPTFFICMVGQGILYTLGVLWLSTFIGMKAAFTFGVFPFILPEIAKAILLSGILRTLGYFTHKASR